MHKDFAICRKGEILDLRWHRVDLDLDERIVRLNPGTMKNDEPRTIPLTDSLFTTLVEQKAKRDRFHPGCRFVFFREGEQILDFRGALDQACFESKLWIGDEKTGKPSRLFHDLRRSGVRNLIRAGVPERVAMAISGHETRSAFDRYNIVSESDLKDAASKLDDFLANRDPPIGTHER